VGDFQRPYFVAELNTSHFGDLNTAKKMVERAKAVGCDCVKFQSWQAKSLYSESYYKNNKIARKMVDKFAFSDSQLFEIANYCRAIGIEFSSTPYSPDEAQFLVEQCRVPFLKIASMEIDNTPFLEFLGALDVPLVLSTGMGEIEEIIRAVATLTKAGCKQLVILHCASVYPAAFDVLRLNNILGLRTEFPSHPIGYSDHSLGIEAPIAATALGACLIEKHFTLDSSRIGMDNQMAMEPDAFAAMITACCNILEAMGGSNRVVSVAEKAQRAKMRRSIISKRDLEKGHVLTVQDLDAKRPGDGISPYELPSLLGRRLTMDLAAGNQISSEHLE
jgi:N-acetylneuraminate synthase